MLPMAPITKIHHGMRIHMEAMNNVPTKSAATTMPIQSRGFIRVRQFVLVDINFRISPVMAPHTARSDSTVGETRREPSILASVLR